MPGLDAKCRSGIYDNSGVNDKLAWLWIDDMRYRVYWSLLHNINLSAKTSEKSNSWQECSPDAEAPRVNWVTEYNVLFLLYDN